jgi:predicted MFS family arabinose efflux permease
MTTIITRQKEIVDQTKSNSTYLAMLFLVCFLGNMLGGTVSTLMSVYLPVVVRDLLGDRSDDHLNYVSAYINSLFLFGWAMGGFCWGFISDRIGRKKSLILAISAYGLFTVLTGMMNSWWGIVACRFISGFGVGGVLVISFTLMSEVWPDSKRAVATGILSIAFPIGIFSAGLINYFQSSWRNGFLIGILPLSIALFSVWLLGESEKWKAHQQGKKAGKPNREVLFSNVNRQSLIAGSLTFGTMLIGLWAIFTWFPSWVQTLSNISDGQKERGLSMMFLGIGGLTGGFLSGWFVNLLGVRRSMVLCFGACSLLAFILFKTNTAFSSIIYPEIATLAIFFGASQGILSSYIPQLFSIPVRATATGFCFNIGRLLTAIAVLFVGVLESALGGLGNAIFIFSLVFIVGLLGVLLTNPQAGNKELNNEKA